MNLNTNLIESLPNALFALKQIKFLDLSNNKLGGLSEAIGMASSLVEIHASGNLIREFPKSFGDLTKLEVLDMKKN